MKKRIYVSVIVTHVILILGPYMLYIFENWLHPRKPAPPVIVVTPVDLPTRGGAVPLGNSVTGKAGGGGTGNTRKPDTPKPQDKPKTPKETKPAPVKEAKPTPPTKDTKPADPKPTPTKDTKPADPKPSPTKDAQKKPLDSSQIKIDTSKVIVKPTTKPVDKKPETVKAQTTKPIDLPNIDDLANKLKGSIKDVNKLNNIDINGPGIKGLKKGTGFGTGGENDTGTIGAPDGSPDGTSGRGGEFDIFYAAVREYIDKKWKEPGKGQLGNAKPVVTVKISVDANGRVLSAEIIERSNNAAMDASVETLLKELLKFPKAPPKGAHEFTLTLNIKDDR